MGFGTQSLYEAPGNLQVGHVEFAPVAISYHLFFLCISNVLSILHHGSVGDFTVKTATLCFCRDIFCCLSSKKVCFCPFHFFFICYEVLNFHNRIITKQKPEQMKRNCQWNYMCNSAMINIRRVSLPPCQLPKVDLWSAGSNLFCNA